MKNWDIKILHKAHDSCFSVNYESVKCEMQHDPVRSMLLFFKLYSIIVRHRLVCDIRAAYTHTSIYSITMWFAHANYDTCPICHFVQKLKDVLRVNLLSVLRNGGYKGVINRMTGLISRAFRWRDQKVLWRAFSTGVLPTLTYAQPAGTLLCGATSKLWRQFKDALLSTLLVVSLTYDQRMKVLGILSLEQLRFFNDIKFLFNCIRDFYNITSFDIGISV